MKKRSWLWPLATTAAATFILVPLTGFMGFPLSALGQHLLGGQIGDAWLNAWTLGQCMDNLLTRPWDLGYAPIFWGEAKPFAFTIAPYGIGFLNLPLYLASGKNLVLTYNLAFLSTWVFTATTAHLFIKRLSGASSWAVALSALAFTFAPFRFLHYAHLETLSMPALLLALWSLSHLLEKPRPAWALFLALMSALTFTTSGSLGLVEACAGIAMVAVAGFKQGGFNRGQVMNLAGAFLGTALLIYPVTQFRFQNETFNAGFGIEEILRYRATLSSWLSSPSLIYAGLHPTDYEGSLFPGFAVLFLSGLGLYAMRRQFFPADGKGHPTPPASLFLLATLWLVAGFLLSLGPRVDVAGFSIPSPYALLMQAPAFSQVRVSARFALVALLGLALVLPWGLMALASRRDHSKLWGFLFAAMAVGFVFVEAIPHMGGPATSRLKAKRPPHDKRLWSPAPSPVHTAVYDYLQEKPGGVVLDLPNDNRGLYHFVYHQRIHKKPILSGTGSYLPHWIWVWNSDFFPNEPSLTFGISRGLKYVVVHGELLGTPEFKSLEAKFKPWQAAGVLSATPLLFGRTALYEVTGPMPPAAAPKGRPEETANPR